MEPLFDASVKWGGRPHHQESVRCRILLTQMQVAGARTPDGYSAKRAVSAASISGDIEVASDASGKAPDCASAT